MQRVAALIDPLCALIKCALACPRTICYLAIYSIQPHMDSQTYTYKSGSGRKAQRQIQNYKPGLMQGMEPNATPAGIIHWLGNQVVEIY